MARIKARRDFISMHYGNVSAGQKLTVEDHHAKQFVDAGYAELVLPAPELLAAVPPARVTTPSEPEPDLPPPGDISEQTVPVAPAASVPPAGKRAPRRTRAENKAKA